MPWVRLDDNFPNNRKISMLSANAFRLYVSALCWSSANLTEGFIAEDELRSIAHVRSAKVASNQLVTRGLWERVEGGWRIHDYLEFNPTRAQVKTERSSNAARQKAYRDRKKAAAKNTDSAEDSDSNAVTVTSRNASRNSTPSRPVPSVTPTEELASYAREPAPPTIGDRPRIPDASRPLVEKLTADGLIVGWDLSSPEWLVLDALIRRCGIDALAVSARASWDGARTQPRSGRYFLPAWRALCDVPEDARHLPDPRGNVTPLTGARGFTPSHDDINSGRVQGRI
jgi:hypothetical protein